MSPGGIFDLISHLLYVNFNWMALEIDALWQKIPPPLPSLTEGMTYRIVESRQKITSSSHITYKILPWYHYAVGEGGGPISSLFHKNFGIE